MKQTARTYCWWPGIFKEIEQYAHICQVCNQMAMNPKETHNPWPEPEHLWQRLHMDFAGPCYGEKWLLVADAKSKYPIVKPMKHDTSAKALIKVPP
jgi:hypothetical protein